MSPIPVPKRISVISNVSFGDVPMADSSAIKRMVVQIQPGIIRNLHFEIMDILIPSRYEKCKTLPYICCLEEAFTKNRNKSHNIKYFEYKVFLAIGIQVSVARKKYFYIFLSVRLK